MHSTTIHYYAVVPHAEERLLLLVQDSGQWALPHFATEVRHFWQSVAHLNRTFQAQLELVLTTLRCLHVAEAERIYLLENHSPEAPETAGAEWFAENDLASLPLAQPRHREQLARWFREDDGIDVSPLRKPWRRPGWFEAASAWIEAHIDFAGLAPPQSFEQVQTWERSNVLRVETHDGETLYFKAAPPMFAHEPALTAALHERWPALTPDVVAHDAERGWLLMRAAGQATLAQQATIDQWESALQSYAQFQIETGRYLEDLRAAGTPARDLDALVAGIDTLLEALPAYVGDILPEQGGQLLSDRAGDLRAMCAELAGLGLPDALEHGDLWPGQIIDGTTGPVFIDWSDSAIAHPFFSANFFGDASEVAEFLPDEAGSLPRLRAAYLAPWEAVAKRVALERAWELALPLSALQYALMYHESILPQMEARWEMENMVPFYLNKLWKVLESEK